MTSNFGKKVDSRNASFNEMHCTCCLLILFTWCNPIRSGRPSLGRQVAWQPELQFHNLSTFLGGEVSCILEVHVFLMYILFGYYCNTECTIFGNSCIVSIYESMLSMWLKIWPLAHLKDDNGWPLRQKVSFFGSDISDGLYKNDQSWSKYIQTY